MLMLRAKIQMGGFKIYLGLKLAAMEGREVTLKPPQPWFPRWSARKTVFSTKHGTESGGMS